MIYDVIIRWKEDNKLEKVKFATEKKEDSEEIFFVGEPRRIAKNGGEDFDVECIIYPIEDDGALTIELPRCDNCRNEWVEDMVDNGEFIDYLDSLGLVNLFEEIGGFKITMEMVYHNTTAWVGDYKSGYRGVSCHLFTACGCNPLSFTATRLKAKNKFWQTTYEC